MADLNVRADAVDVEQVMRQIRARIREKRGADYTETELQQLASVKLEKFLDPRGVRSDLVEEFRRQNAPSAVPPNYEFGEETLYETHRGVLRSLRSLFKPILKLFFNPDKITSALHIQAEVNTQAEHRLRKQEQRTVLYYELVHNLTVEVTRLGIEVHNLKMRAESLSSRLDFSERRARSLEGAVQYKPEPPRQQHHQPNQNQSAGPREPVASTADNAPSVPGTPGPDTPPVLGGGASAPGDRRRRRRRRRRRPGSTTADAQGLRQPGQSNGQEPQSDAGGFDGGGPDDGPDDGDFSDPSDTSDQ